MPAKPSLPAGYDLPETVNGWRHNPDDGSNGHAWYLDAGKRPLSVRVFEHLGHSYANVTDERTTGSESSETIAECCCDEDGDQTEQAIVAAVVSEAVEWMGEHGPGEWAHPRIHETVFDPPIGYKLITYEIGQRWSSIHYRRIDEPGKSRLAGVGRPGEVTPETHPYLVIRTWAGSGNSEIELAPWRFAHDDEREPVADPPAGCGLDVAMTEARAFAREQHDRDAPFPSGQPDQIALGQFEGGE